MSIKWGYITAVLITLFLFNVLYFGVFNGNTVEASAKASDMMTSVQNISVLSPQSMGIWIGYIQNAVTWDYVIFNDGVLSWVRAILIFITAPAMAWLVFDLARILAFGLSSITSWFRW